jgi:SAM-dependent methyltransferase
VIRKFGDISGKVIADIGSGTGYFTIPISRVASRVIAIDIEQRYLDYIEDRKLELPINQADRIETRLTVENEPNLHTDEVDAILMVNVFYYLNDRINYMQIVRDALKENGILVLVDFKPGDMPVGPSDNKVPVEEVVGILRSAGFEDVVVDEESLQYQYIITAN